MPSIRSSVISVLVASGILLTANANPIAVGEPSPVAVGNPSPVEEKRAVSSQGCAGDYSGKKIGVLACANVKFKDFNSIDVDLSVLDSKGDSNDVYGWFRVYGPDGYYKDLPKAGHLRNSLGVGHTVSANGLTWDQGVGKITGFRAKACVDDAGKDTCTDGPFIANPYA